MERLTAGSPAPTHDLVRLREPIELMADEPMPLWAQSALRRVPWVVVRRGHVRDGMIPVGVRGLMRSQRFAAFVAIGAIAERLTPEDLTDSRLISKGNLNCRALAALGRVAPILAGRRWGPGGSVGFEIATGAAAATWSSDLDLIVRQERRLALNEAIALLGALTEAAAPTRIDVMLETPCGGVALAELAGMPGQVLVRTPDGPRLVVDPLMLMISQGLRRPGRDLSARIQDHSNG